MTLFQIEAELSALLAPAAPRAVVVTPEAQAEADALAAQVIALAAAAAVS